MGLDLVHWADGELQKGCLFFASIEVLHQCRKVCVSEVYLDRLSRNEHTPVTKQIKKQHSILPRHPLHVPPFRSLLPFKDNDYSNFQLPTLSSLLLPQNHPKT